MKIGAHKIKPCGKYFNSSIYVHKYFASKVKAIDIHLVHAAADHLPKDFVYDIIRYDKNTNNISFIELINFDTADVPLVGDSYLVRSDLYAANRKDGKKVKFTRMKDDPQIKLHKWLYVPEDYKYFDWSASVAYSEKIMKHEPPAIQKLSEWVSWLKDNKIKTESWYKLYLPQVVTSDKNKRIIKQEVVLAEDVKFDNILKQRAWDLSLKYFQNLYGYIPSLGNKKDMEIVDTYKKAFYWQLKY